MQNKTLGPTSANFIHRLIELGKTIFTLEEACDVYGKGKKETSDFIGDLINRSVLARIKPGIFLILQMGQESTQLDNWPIIAHFLVGQSQYFISHYSAMRLHGMTTHPLMTVIVTLSKRNRPKKVHNLSYQFIYSKPDRFWGISELWITKQEKVCVSDLERTILDCLERPDLCGGAKEIIKGIWGKQKQIDWNKLAHYANKYHSKAAVKRLGFILEKLNLGAQCIPLLEKIISSRKDYVLLDPSASNIGHYINRWWLRINIDENELIESVWG